jgi:hypothetical protein
VRVACLRKRADIVQRVLGELRALRRGLPRRRRRRLGVDAVDGERRSFARILRETPHERADIRGAPVAPRSPEGASAVDL